MEPCRAAIDLGVEILPDEVKHAVEVADDVPSIVELAEQRVERMLYLVEARVFVELLFVLLWRVQRFEVCRGRCSRAWIVHLVSDDADLPSEGPRGTRASCRRTNDGIAGALRTYR